MNFLIIDEARWNYIDAEAKRAFIQQLDYFAIKHSNGKFSIIKDRSGMHHGTDQEGEFEIYFRTKKKVL